MARLYLRDLEAQLAANERQSTPAILLLGVHLKTTHLHVDLYISKEYLLATTTTRFDTLQKSHSIHL